MRGLCVFFLISYSIAVQAQSNSLSLIPESRKVDWSKAKATIANPSISIDITTLPLPANGNDTLQDDSALVQAFRYIQTHYPNQACYLYFPKGNYSFYNTINLPSHIILKGSGSEHTFFNFYFLNNFTCINASGTKYGTLDSLNYTGAPLDSATQAPVFKKGLRYIRVLSPNNYQVGSLINMYTSGLHTSAWAANDVGQILKVISKKADTLFFADELRMDFIKINHPKLVRINPVKNIGIECLSLVRKNVFSIVNGVNPGTSNIQLTYVENARIKDIESEFGAFAHISLSYCTNSEITSSFFNNAVAHGEGGQGYGLAMQGSTGNVLIKENIFKRLRHSLLIQAGSNGNVVDGNYSYDPYCTGGTLCQLMNYGGDIVVHGNYPYSNLIKNNLCAFIVSDNSHGKNGPFNTFIDNYAYLGGVYLDGPTANKCNFVGNKFIQFLFWSNPSQLNVNDVFSLSNTFTLNLPIPSSYFNVAHLNFLNGELTGCTGNNSTDIKQEEPKTKKVIYPNPAKELLNLSQTYENIKVYNLEGQFLVEYKNQNNLSVSELVPGMYVLQLENKGERENKIFTKQ